MTEVHLGNYSIILLFIASAVLFSALGLMASSFLSSSRPNPEKLKSYESGEEPMDDARIQYNPGYFIIALIFLLFEVEIIFLFPWALIFDQAPAHVSSEHFWSILTLTEMFVFLFILILGLIFVWKKGFLDWPKPVMKKEPFKSHIPSSLYDDFNKKYESR